MRANCKSKFCFLSVLIIFQSIFSLSSFAQVFGNEWIVPGQSYYKIPVGQTGMYAVSLDRLRTAGIPIAPGGTVQPEELQLFHRGVEQAVLVNNDTLFFYGMKNDGTLDSLLYEPYSSQPHKYYNLYSDTTAYFLTWVRGVNGKRMSSPSVTSAASPEVYHMEEMLMVLNDEYERGNTYGNGEAWMAYGDNGEAWMGPSVVYNGNQYELTYNFNPTNVYTSGPSVNFEIMLVGRNGYSGSFNHYINLTFQDGVNPPLVYSVPPFDFHNIKKFTVQIPASYFTSGNFTVKVKNMGNGDLNNITNSYVSVAYIKIDYPQTYNMGGTSQKYFNVVPNSSDVNISISNPAAGTKLFDITDKDNIQLINTTLQGSALNASLAASSVAGHNLFAVSSISYLSIPDIYSVALDPYSNEAAADFILVTNKKIISGANEYASYRSSVQGGAFNPLVATVQDLYDKFSYGERTPVAIRRFMSYLFANGNPKYLFLVGKGLLIDYSRGGPLYRKNPAFYINNPDTTIKKEDLVPTFGVPGSDLLFVAGLNGAPKQVAAIPVGRFSAKNNAEIANYLEKVREHDSASNALWRKNLLHLSGGNTDSEKVNFLSFVNGLKVIAEDTIFGGKVVKTISKSSSSTVDNELIGNIADVLNSGVSYVTFFGHSSPNITDLDIGFVSQDFYGYRNAGKYPLLLADGCLSANVFTWDCYAEDWLRTPGRGAIVTIGHTDNGFVTQLQNYSTLFYNNAFRKRSMIGKSSGDIQVETIKEFYTYYGVSDYINLATLEEMNLQGDPAIKIYTPQKTDYQTDDTKVSVKSLDGQIVTAVSDSFAIKIIVSNLGLDFGDSLQVSVKRTINGKTVTYGPVLYKDIKYQDTIYFKIKTPDVATYGENIFDIYLDPNDLISEMDETNNHASFTFFMPLSGVICLFPKEYSIVNSNPVTFVAQSTNLLIAPTDYYIEIDTSYLFNSPVKKDTIVNSGSLIKWEHTSLPILQDSLVYYWRVRYENIAAGEDTLWGQSSFIYIHNSPEGWSQSEFPQFFKDGLIQTDRNIPSRKWEFSITNTPIFVRTVGSNYQSSDPHNTTPSSQTVIQIYGINYNADPGFFCSQNSLLAVAFDRITGQPYSPYPSGNFCGTTSIRTVNSFNALYDSTLAASPSGGAQSQANLSQYLNNVKNGDYVLLISSGDVYFSKWSSTLKSQIKSDFSAQLLDSLSSGIPYILISRKGDPAPIQEVYGPNTVKGIIQASDTLIGKNKTGYISSTLIGPATQWGTFYHNFNPSEYPVTDSDSLMIIGVDITGKNIDTLTISQKDSLDLTTVPGLSQYPYIRLLAQITDTTNLTPPQLMKWQVIYSGVPEGTMDPSVIGLNTYDPVTKLEGDSLKVCYAFENISNYNFKDTLQVKFTITNSNSGSKSQFVKLVPLQSDSMITFCHTFSSKGMVGNNILQAYVNPQIQKEEYYNNNIIEMIMNVEVDKTHPILDVVFDGTHIMNGDIVSPSPLITITLNDENPYMIRNNSNGIDVYLQRPGQSLPQLVDPSLYTGKQVGVNGKNVYQIEYNPSGLPDGTYTLIVKAKDVAGNTSGVEDYQISFEVINESTITNFYPYPNPFSTSTRFVFTLTGNQIPQDLKIQIMTVTGIVVREITQAELGTIKIGNNKTDYAWDGTDEFGDKLANGVYLYRVVIKNAGDFQHRQSAGDKAFKKDWGKLYILR